MHERHLRHVPDHQALIELAPISHDAARFHGLAGAALNFQLLAHDAVGMRKRFVDIASLNRKTSREIGRHVLVNER